MSTRLIAPSTTSRAGKTSSRRWRTYSDVATLLGYELCRDGFCPWSGIVIGRTVHWRERRMERRGLRTFLRVIAIDTMVVRPNEPRYMTTYALNKEIDRLAKIIGVRFPRELSAMDRAKVRYWLSKSWGHETPDRIAARRRIARWARA